MRPARNWMYIVALGAFLVAMPMGFAEPRDGWSLEARVPSSAMALLSIEDVGGMAGKFEKTAIAGLFREPEMQAFAKPIAEALGQLAASADGGPFGDATPMVMKFFEQMQGLKGQLAVALLDVHPERGFPVSVVASLDFGPNVGDFVKFLGGLAKEIDPQGRAINVYQKDGRTWWQVQEGPPITATTVDTAFVIATDPTLLEGVLAGPGERSLAADADFQAVHARAGADQLALLAYGNVPAVLERFGGEMPAEARRIANGMGLDTIRAAAYGMAFSGDGFMDSFIVHAPDASHGLVPLLDIAPYEPRALARVPANAFYYEEGRSNIAELLPNVRKLVGAVEANAVEGMDDMLRGLDNALGVSIEDDILGGLAGGACSYMSMPATGGLFPEVVMMLEVKDPAAFEAAMGKLAQGIAGMVSEEGDVIASTREMTYREHTLHLFEMQAARGDDVIPFTPTWAVLDGWLTLTLVPHTMKEFILRGATTSGGGLAAQEDFQSLRAVMPEQAGQLTYLDLQAILNLLYDTAVPVLQTAVKPNVLGREVPFTLDWAQLPAARTVHKYFRSLAVYSTWNKDGIAIQVHGPIPMAGIVMVGAAIAVPMALAPVRRRSVRAERIRPMPPRRVRPVPDEPAKAQPAAPAKARMARIQAEQISSYVRVFLLTQERLPASLDELVEKNVASSLPKDPWGKAFKLFVLDEKARKFVVRSAGPDGSFDTADDVESSS